MRARWLVLMLLGGCPDDPRNCSGFVGDTSAPVEIQMIVRNTDGSYTPVEPGASVPLIEPPQGGKVIFAGVRARNLDTCGIKLTSSLRDTCTNRIIGLEGRPANLRATGDGWAEPDRPMEIQNYTNLAVCPSAAAERDVEGEPYLLRVAIEDRGGRTAEQKIMVVPFCAEPTLEKMCHCQCDADYVLGDPCVDEADGGLPPGTCPADGGM